MTRRSRTDKASLPAEGGRFSHWGKRLAVAILAPICFLLLAEGVLRLAGFGHPTAYFVPSEVEARRMVENPEFGRRFFPPGLMRVPPLTTFLREKPEGTIRIFVFGESAAMGDPKPAFGVGRYLETLLNERYAGTTFEVIPVAMTAINSHALLVMARQCADLGADYWIVFAGNNEMLGPYGAGTVLGRRAPPWRLVRLILAVKATRLGQAIEVLLGLLIDRPEGSTRWAGIRVLAGETVTRDAPERTRVYRAFEENLRDLVRAGKAGGARVLLSTVAVNLKDCAPFGSAHLKALSLKSAGEWNQWFEGGKEALASGQPAAALGHLGKAASVDERHAALQFLLARGHLALTNQEAASKEFSLARDLDVVPLRADSELNAVVRRVAAEEAAVLIEGARALAEASRDGVPGSESFYEHVHLTPDGNYALARAFAEKLSEMLPETVRDSGGADWALPGTCATHLALTPWARAAAAESMLARCMDAPFTNRWNSDEQIQQLAAEAARQRRALTPEGAQFVLPIFTNAIAADPDDHFLRQSYAEFLEATGDLQAAAAEWNRIREMLPHHPMAFLQAGSLLRRTGQIDAARPLIERAVVMQPDWMEAHLELGELFLARGRPADAVNAFRDALRLQPTHARGHLRLAEALAADRQREAAVAELEEAVRLDSDLWEARYLLGVEYAIQERLDAAREQFGHVVRLQPEHALAQFNLGIALARQQRWGEAAQHLAEAVRLDPRNQEAKQALAQVVMMRPKQPQPGGENDVVPQAAPPQR
jgi:tetratricopeptide (TPR) repeat protein